MKNPEVIIDDTLDLEVVESECILRDTMKHFKKDGQNGWPTNHMAKITNRFNKLLDEDLLKLRIFLRKEYIRVTKHRMMNYKKERYIYYLDKATTEIYNNRIAFIRATKIKKEV